jgi:hypothetical protein
MDVLSIEKGKLKRYLSKYKQEIGNYVIFNKNTLQ